MKIKLFYFLFYFSFLLPVSAQSMKFEQVLQQVIDHYPSVKTAVYQVERARQENKKIESQLGWQLNSQLGFSRDVSLFGTPTDTLNLSAGLSRNLTSGAILGIDAVINKDDASTVFSPALANPVTSTRLNLNYRQPLEKGLDNPLYEQGLKAADASFKFAEADRKLIYDQLATQVIELYLAAAITQVRIYNSEQTITRSKRLQKYIKDRLNLGVSEEKDILQVEAQLKGQQAEKKGLFVIWQKQKIALNRLMGKKWDSELEPYIQDVFETPKESESILLDQVKLHSPSMLSVKAQLQLAESEIESRRDSKKDKLDLVMFVGNASSEGNTISGEVSESEIVGGIKLEFNRGMDKSGLDAELYQAQLDRGIALQNQKQIIEDLQYSLSSLLAEVKAGKSALGAYQQSFLSEKKKLDEAVSRYKKGRADTDQIIQFEAQLSLAELSVELQKIELLRLTYNLNLLRGELWKTVRIPEVTIAWD